MGDYIDDYRDQQEFIKTQPSRDKAQRRRLLKYVNERFIYEVDTTYPNGLSSKTQYYEVLKQWTKGRGLEESDIESRYRFKPNVLLCNQERSEYAEKLY